MRPRRPPAAGDPARRPAPSRRPARPPGGVRWAAMIINPAVSNGQARPDRVERVLQVVGAGGDVDAGLPAGRRRRSGRAASAPAPRPWRNRFVWGSATTLTPAAATSSATRRCVGVRALPEAHAVAGGGRMGETGEHRTAQFAEAVDRRIERLVGVEIDADAEVGGDAEQDVGRRDRGRRSRCGTAADEVGAGGHRLTQQRPLVGATGARHRPAAQGDDLDRDETVEPFTHGGERLDAAQAVLQGEVGVGPDRDVAVGRPSSGPPAPPVRRCRRTVVR